MKFWSYERPGGVLNQGTISPVNFYLSHCNFSYFSPPFAKITPKPGMVVYTFSPCIGRWRQENLYEFEASLLYIVRVRSSRDV